MNRDTVIGIAGAAVLVVAMVGVFVYERGVAEAAGVGAGNGVEALEIAGPSLDGTTPVGESTEETLTIAERGVTNVTFTLRWSAGAGADTLRLTVAPSADTGVAEGAMSGNEDDGEITLSVAVPNTAPDGAAGVGAWQVTVEFVSASTGTPLPPGVAPGTSDAQVSWTVETTLAKLPTG